MLPKLNCKSLFNNARSRVASLLQMRISNVSASVRLAEEVTSNDPWGPDAKTMTRIADASFDMDDYWRVVDVLHRRFDWGAAMQKKSDRIIQLLRGGENLKQSRLKAIKVTREIQGFGSLHMSPPISPSSSTPPSGNSTRSSFGTFSPTSSTWSGYDQDELFETKTPINADSAPYNCWAYAGQTKQYENPVSRTGLTRMSRQTSGNVDDEGTHGWNSPKCQESGSLIEEDEDEQKGQKKEGILNGIKSKLSGMSPKFGHDGSKTYFKSFSDAGREMKKKIDHQLTMKD